jgi:nucleoside-diphosphate-sugar epimerase
MRIVVIGGSGFLGSYLTPQLVAAGHDVTVVSRPGSTTPIAAGARRFSADRQRLADYATSLRTIGADIVIDLVLSSGRQAQELVDVFRGSAAHLVAITSIDVYRATSILFGLEGNGELEPLPLTEDSPRRSVTQTYPPQQLQRLQQIFGWLDDEYDKIPVEDAVRGGGTPSTILRLPMIYGPGDRLHRFRPLLKRMDDKLPQIVFAESVAQWRSPRGYVENVAAAIALAAQNIPAEHRIYNVAEAESFSELEWGELIARVIGWHGEFVVLPDADTPAHLRIPGNLKQHWVADSTRIRTELGYREPVTREDAVRRTVEWERVHPPASETAVFDYAAESEAASRYAASR